MGINRLGRNGRGWGSNMKVKRYAVSVLVLLVSSAMLVGCAVGVTGVSLDSETLSLTVNDTRQLVATITPANAANKSVQWSSSDTTVATVSDTGLVTARAAGTAIIAVTTVYGGRQASCRVTVAVATTEVPPAISSGYWHTVALRSDGTVWTWGSNLYGQMGDDSRERHTPTQVNGLNGVTAIAAGEQNTVALKSDGTVWAWGNNDWGQLGDGTTSFRRTLVQVSGLIGVTAISAGALHTVALKADGTVWVWGWNSHGILGEGTTMNRHAPVQVSDLAAVTAISAGQTHTVALKSDGTVWTWGGNFSGQLGDGTMTLRTVPTPVSGLTGVSAISAGWQHTVALRSDGTVLAWGDNHWGQLGDDTTTAHLTPVRVSGLTGVTAISAGGWYFTVALRHDGTVWAWGNNVFGLLGDGTTTNRLTPHDIGFKLR